MVVMLLFVAALICWLFSVLEYVAFDDDDMKTAETLYDGVAFIQTKQMHYWMDNISPTTHLKSYAPKKDTMMIILRYIIFYLLLSDSVSSYTGNAVVSQSQATIVNVKRLVRPVDFISNSQSYFVFPLSRKKLDTYFSIPQTSYNDYTYEWFRLRSFKDMPSQYDTSSIRLAQAGFYWNNDRHAIVCFSCELVVKFTRETNVIKEHEQRSSNCKHLLGTDERNVPIRYDDISSMAQEANFLRNDTNTNTCQNQNTNSKVSTRTTGTANVTKCTENNSTHCMTNAELSTSSSGTGCSVSNSTVSACSNLPINMATSESGRTQHNAKDREMSTFGINFNRPRYPAFAVVSIRISSFQGWPGYLTQTPKTLAVAGFFYVGYGDYTRCFFCGGGLRNWGNGDDAWIEHARWFPRCAFVLMNKGREFVSLVQEEHNRHEQENHQCYNNATAEDTSLYIKRQFDGDDVTSQPLFTQAVNMGFSKEQVLRKIKEMLDTKTDLRSISPTAFIESLLDHRENTQNDHTVKDTPVINKHIPPGENSVSKELDKLSLAALESKKGKQEDTNDLPQLKRNIPADNGDTLNTELFSLMEENRELRRQRECKICLDAEANITFLPCGHLCCCASCASALRKCPICRKAVRGSVRTLV